MKPSRILALSAVLLSWPVSGRAEEGQALDASAVIATAGDTKVTAAEKEVLGETILTALLETYAEDRKINVSDEEIAKFTARLAEVEKQDQARFQKRKSELTAELQAPQLAQKEREKKAAELAGIEEFLKNAAASGDGLTDAEKMEIAEARKGMAQAVIKAWKINKSLFDQYGGRVIYQQMGAEPLDAYRKFLEAQLQAGAIKLSDKKYEPDLWRTFTNDSLHDFVPDAQRSALINTPPWERKETSE